MSIEAGDEPETGYYIALKPPICTVTNQENWMLRHDRVSEVQLVMTKTQYDQLSEHLSGVISIKGTLFEAFNGHHHTSVLIEVKSFAGAETHAAPSNIKRENTAKGVKPITQKSIIKPAKVNNKAKLSSLKKRRK